MFLRALPLLVLAALSMPPCLAQDAGGAAARPLTLAQAIDLALASHPRLAAARSDVAAAEAARLRSAAWPNPVLEAEIEGGGRDTRSTTVLLTQPLEPGARRVARAEAAGREHALAEGRHAAQRAQLRARVAGAFFDVLAAQERVRLADEGAALARRASEAAARRVAAGKVAPIEETKARVAEARLRVDRLQAEGELRAARQAFAAAVGVPQVAAVAGDALPLPAVPSDEAVQARLAHAPAVTLAALEVERLGALARLERARRVPEVQLGVGAKRSEERTQAVVTVSIPLPVFDTNRPAELEALRREAQARSEAEAARLQLRAEAGRAHERLRAAVAEAQALAAEVLPGAEQAYEAAGKGFELGKFGFLDVLDAQRTLVEARTQHVRAVAEAHRAAADLDRLLGDEDPAAPLAARNGGPRP